MKGLFIPEITAEMFRNGCLESIEALMAEGEIYDIDYTGWIPCSERLPKKGMRAVLLYSNEKISGGVYLGDRVWNVDYNDTDLSVYIVAWMPLPEPYEAS